MALFKATKMGWTGKKLARPGDIFVMPDGSEGKWFEPYGDGPEVDPDYTPVTDSGITVALSQLDPQNDLHWTKDGDPMMKVVEDLMGVRPRDLTRADLRRVAPNLCRANATATNVLS